MIGRELGHYRIKDEISRGGMGVVYRAVDTRLNCEAEAAPHFEFVTRAGAGRIYAPMLYVRSFYFLGRIAEKMGDKAAARQHYERFLFYWKGGDTDRDHVAEAERKLKSL